MNEGLRSFLGSPEVQRDVEVVVTRCEELHAQHEECLQALSDSGWFVRPDTPVTQLQVLKDSLGTNGGLERSAIELYFEERIDSRPMGSGGISLATTSLVEPTGKAR